MKKKFIFPLSFALLSFIWLQTGNAQWRVTNAPATNPIYCFAASSLSGIVAGASGEIYGSKDLGVNWTSLKANLPSIQADLPNPIINGVATSGTDLYIACFGSDLGGGVYVCSAGGAWQNCPAAGVSFFSIVTKGKEVFAGSTGSIKMTIDKGKTWSSTSLSSLADIYYLDVTGDTVVAGSSKGIFTTIDDGKNWAQNTTAGFVTCLCLTPTVSFAGTKDGVYKTSNVTGDWAAANMGINGIIVTSIVTDGSTVIAATLDSGIFFSKDNGGTWIAANDGLPVDNDSFNALTISGRYVLLGTGKDGIWRRDISEFGAASVSSKQKKQNISISPNPTSDFIMIHSADVPIVHVTVSNLLGEKILDQKGGDANDVRLDLSEFSAGTYFVSVAGASSSVTKRIVVK